VPQFTEGGKVETTHIPLAFLIEIIKPRIEEILDMVKQSIKKSDFDGISRSIVITGGASQISGLKEYMANSFNMPVRSGCPISVDGLAESTKGPAFATVVGILEYVSARMRDASLDPIKKPKFWSNPLVFIALWLKEYL